MFWLGVLSGFFLPFIGFAAILIFQEAFSKSHSLECVAEDLAFETGQKTRIELWFIWKWHINTVGRKAWHKKAIADYLRKWGR